MTAPKPTERDREMAGGLADASGATGDAWLDCRDSITEAIAAARAEGREAGLRDAAKEVASKQGRLVRVSPDFLTERTASYEVSTCRLLENDILALLEKP